MALSPAERAHARHVARAPERELWAAMSADDDGFSDEKNHAASDALLAALREHHQPHEVRNARL